MRTKKVLAGFGLLAGTILAGTIIVGQVSPRVVIKDVVIKEMRREGSLKVGDVAPDFHLTERDGVAQVRLSSFKTQKPVALVFGSYT